MTDQHRATPEQWEVVEICREEGKIPWPTATALLELRSRIEALEAMHTDKLDRLIELDRDDPAMTELRAASAEARPAGLVERVAGSIWKTCDLRIEARAAIREVAAWLSEHTDDDASAYWAARLEQEADRG